MLLRVRRMLLKHNTCHSDDRREEESRNHKVDVLEILRRFAPLNDITEVFIPLAS